MAVRSVDSIEVSRRVIPVSTRNAGRVFGMTGMGGGGLIAPGNGGGEVARLQGPTTDR